LLPNQANALQRLIRRVTRFRESVARRYRFRQLAGTRLVGPVTMEGSSASAVGEDL
jgi:hypothetical protein